MGPRRRRENKARHCLVGGRSTPPTHRPNRREIPSSRLFAHGARAVGLRTANSPAVRKVDNRAGICEHSVVNPSFTCLFESEHVIACMNPKTTQLKPTAWRHIPFLNGRGYNVVIQLTLSTRCKWGHIPEAISRHRAARHAVASRTRRGALPELSRDENEATRATTTVHLLGEAHELRPTHSDRARAPP